MITYRGGTMADAEWLAPRLRAADRAECWAAQGLAAEVTLRRSVEASSVLIAAEVDGELAALFGIAPVGVMAGHGAPWMLATPLADQHGRAWLRDAPQWLTLIGDGWSVLRNCVDARNLRSIRWLRRMGFEVGKAAPWGWAGLPFHPFEMRLGGVSCARQS